MMKLKQVCNHPAHFLADGSSLPGRSGKLTRLVEVLEEAVAEGDRALVFTQFTEMGDTARAPPSPASGLRVSSGSTAGCRRRRGTPWSSGSRAPTDAPVFLLSLKAGGTGLNLTAATHVVHFDRWWNPAVEDQATDRAFRIGQTRNVQVRKFVCGGTLEERIDDMIESKRALAERIVGIGRGLDHRDVHRPAPRGGRPVGRRGGGGLMPPRRPSPATHGPSGDRGDGWWPPPSKPIAVEGGLQARSQRGRIGDTWWSQRFIAVLEAFGIGSRLQRGKRYARTGQVLSMEVDRRAGEGLGAGFADQALPGLHRDRRAHRCRVGRDRGGHGVERGLRWPGCWPTRCPRRSRRRSPSRRRSLFPTSADELELGLLVPGLGEPVQAHRRGLLPAGRGLRRRPVPHLRLAREGQGRAAHRPAGPPPEVGPG